MMEILWLSLMKFTTNIYKHQWVLFQFLQKIIKEFIKILRIMDDITYENEFKVEK